MYGLLFTGSGIYKQQQDTYTQLTEGESIYLTEDITLVCVSSTAGLSAWYYRNISTGVEERITEGTEVMNSKGFLTLSLQTTNRAGYYICKTTEVTEDTFVSITTELSIIVPLTILTTTPTPTTTPTTTPTPTTPSIPTTTTTTPTPTPTTPSLPTLTTAPKPTRTPTIITPTTTISNNTQAGREDTLPYPIIGLIAGVLVSLFLVIIVMILVIVFIVKRRKTNKSGYTEQIQTDNPEDTTTGVNNNNNNKEYINLQDLPIKRKPVPPPNTKKPGYNYKYTKKSLEETTPPANTSDKKEYISLSDVHTGTKIQQTHNYEPMASVYPPHSEYIPLEVTTRPNYSEIPDSHFDSENDSTDRKYENLASVISS